jgi:hypothetical protein
VLIRRFNFVYSFVGGGSEKDWGTPFSEDQLDSISLGVFVSWRGNGGLLTRADMVRVA